MILIDFIQKMPKAELHVHLEGSIRPETLLTLTERNQIRLPFQDIQGVQEFYRFRNFAHFLDVYVTVTKCLRTPEDYELIAYEFGRQCSWQNIRYAEVTFSMISNMTHSGLPWPIILDGINAGRARASADFGLRWNWVFDIVRNSPEEQGDLLEIALAARDRGVVALGLGGDETHFPPNLFTATFERARQAGLPSVPHSGETAGPASIWEALKLLHADRLGHGVRSIEDPRLVEHLRQRQVPLEVCPTSNIRLRLYHDYAQHPLRRLWDAGLLVTVNSDDPPMFETSLNQEYQVLAEHFGFTLAELEQVSLNAVQASFLSAAEKAQLTAEFQIEFTRLEETTDEPRPHPLPTPG